MSCNFITIFVVVAVAFAISSKLVLNEGEVDDVMNKIRDRRACECDYLI